MRKNALQVLIPKFGLEGTVYLNSLKDDAKKLPSNVTFTFNEEVNTKKNSIKREFNNIILYLQDYTQRCGDIVFHAFDPVTVRLSLDSTNVQHEKLVFQLVKPYIKGFSVEPEELAEETKENQQQDIEMSPAPPQKKSKKSKQNKK